MLQQMFLRLIGWCCTETQEQQHHHETHQPERNGNSSTGDSFKSVGRFLKFPQSKFESVQLLKADEDNDQCHGVKEIPTCFPLYLGAAAWLG